ncbi:MAG: hypothetical protein AAGI08_17000 [Bacteroidota bacterium]
MGKAGGVLDNFGTPPAFRIAISGQRNRIRLAYPEMTPQPRTDVACNVSTAYRHISTF